MRSAWRVCTLLVLIGGSLASALAQEESSSPELIYVPTPQEVVDEMLKVTAVGKSDVVYDLGCGDGRLVITAAKMGARGVGIDINPVRIKEAEENAQAAGVKDRVTFRNGDIFEADVSRASVVTLYLLTSTLDRLLPKLRKELKPGTRIVSHDFRFTDWDPDKEIGLEGHTLFLWTVPAEPPPASPSKAG